MSLGQLELREYKQIISRQIIPQSVIATSPDGSVWSKGEDRNLCDFYWQVRTADETKLRDAVRTVSFSDAVAFPGILLSAPRHYHDAATKRILCLEILKGKATGRDASAVKVWRLMRDFDWLLRWRNALGFDRFDALERQHYDIFVNDAATTDRCVLVPLRSRLAALANDPHYQLPLYRFGRAHRLEWGTFATTLGVTLSTLQHSRLFKGALEEYIAPLLEKSGLKPDDVKLYVHASTPKHARTFQDLTKRLVIWSCIGNLSVKGLLTHDRLKFTVPAPSLGAFHGNRTAILLPYDMMRVASAAASWVALYKDHIRSSLRVRTQLSGRKDEVQLVDRALRRLNNARPRGFPLISFSPQKAPLGSGQIRLNDAVKLLFAACAILIGFFGARRTGEVYSLRSDGYFESAGRSWLSIYIEKTLQDVDAIPVPLIIKEVVQLLTDLSMHAREATGEEWLFQFKASFGHRRTFEVETRFDRYLGEFVQTAGLVPPAGEQTWHLNYHMFRKGFVIAYYHGNLTGSFDGANRMLRHSSGDMTRIYMDGSETGEVSWLRNEVARLTRSHRKSDDEVAFLRDAKRALRDRDGRKGLWNEARQEFFVSKIMEIYDGIERPIGRGAARILDDLRTMDEEAHSCVRLSAIPTNWEDGARANVETAVKRAAFRQFLEPVPGRFAYCAFQRNSAQHMSLANCLTHQSMSSSPWQTPPREEEQGHPDYAFSGLHPCLACELCVVLNANQQVLGEHVQSAKFAVEKAGTPAMAATAQRYLDDLISLIEEAERAVDGRQRPHLQN